MELSYAQSILTGFIQGITELFPISSLGHAVLIPAWVGGDWASFITDPASPYLTVTIALHAASALALFLVFRKRWFSMFGATLKSVGKRGYSTPNSKLFLMLVIATIPVGLLGYIFEGPLQNLFGDPLPSAIFLTLNGLILILVERLTRNNKAIVGSQSALENISDHITPVSALAVGFGQCLALFAGISRFGITISAGLIRKMHHSVAAEFAFLLALPVIAGASLLKLPELFTPELHHLAGPVIAGSIVSFGATYFSISFLVKWFQSKTLYPFAIYCLVVGAISIVKFI
jgi:undecaprenyl-diphosphatase